MNVTRSGALIYIMVCLTISVSMQAQENRAPLQKQVRIMNTLFSIDSLSRLITVQSGVFLSFNSNKVAAGRKIVTQKRSYAVAELLDLIKSNTGSDYKIYKDHVIFHGGDKTIPVSLVNKPSSAKPKTATSISAAKSSRTSTRSSRNPTANTETHLPQKPTANTETQFNNAPLDLEPLKTTMQKPSITLLLKPAIIAQHPTPFPKKTRWFADAGFTVDDVLYLNTSITAGHKFLHGFFSWSSSFKVSGFRYGLGSMVPLNDKWRIGLMVTTGKLKRNINFADARDTLNGITVKSELHRLAIQVEKSLRPNLIVKAGPVFNLLRSSYYQDGTPVTIATSGYEGTNGDREFYTVRPLYTLSNSYKNTESANTKTWLGFQVSLCYRFNF
jgi:hypothetical protein